MDDDWRTDDLALCIKQGQWRDHATKGPVSFGPKAGAMLTVRWVSSGELLGVGKGTILNFSDWPRDWFVARNFVKIRPHEGSDDDDEATAISEDRILEPGAR